MSLIAKNNKSSKLGKSNEESATSTRVNRERFILGTSECYFEPADYLGTLPDEKVVALFANPNVSLAETQGKSLKVMFKTENELKFVGFVTAGDASIDLEEDSIEQIFEFAAAGPIVKAINADDLVAMF